MMKTAVLSAALVGAASAIHVPGRLVPVLPGSLDAHLPQHERRQVGGIRPDIVDDLPEDCRDAAESLLSVFPAEPSSFEEFSSSFYETASRTASETYLDCAWVTEMPESLYTEFTDYGDELIDWLEEEENIKKVLDFGYDCEEWASSGGLASAGDAPCSVEWSEFGEMVIDGEFPPKLYLLLPLLARSSWVEQTKPGVKRCSCG